ncbi:MAG TPA: glycoside hydrolase family 2 TIM barrel-domain containing protein, partial [Verrucomicrobiae bacterium]|nr:glycoside hydrolase family 2 TIM barrel-domain containing protein [Verrucomicrobiae bacterium]
MTRWAAEVNPTNALPEYPRPQMVRNEWLNLNGLWNYAITPISELMKSESVNSPTRSVQAGGTANRGDAWRTTAQSPTRRFADSPFPPMDGQILVPFPIESALSGVMRRLDEKSVLWYQRKVTVPPEWRGQRVRLHFEAVDWQARVSVNGKEVGQHRGGYDGFGFDITDQLRWNGEEEIVVAVTDPTEGDQPRGKQSRKPEGIFYTPTSGIWQTVWLEPVPKVSVDRLKLVPDVDGEALRIQASVNSFAENLRIEAVAIAGGQEVARVIGPPNTELSLTLTNAHLWTPDDPFLYDLRVTLHEEASDTKRRDGETARRGNGETERRRDGELADSPIRPLADSPVLDTVTSCFGMRKVALQKDSQGAMRVALNGKFIFQIGTLDQGFWPDGIYTAPTDAALRSDIEFLKKSGFNLTRKHVKVEPERWYYWCDKLGLLVWQDMPSGNNATVTSRRDFEAELMHMVHRLENHPSIIVWVLFNEGWGQYDTERLAQRLKALDPSRLVNNASGWTDMRVGDLIDMHSYPGPDCPAAEPRRAAVLGEFGGLGLPVDGHSWSSRCWGYLMLQNSQELAARYTRAFKQVWALHHFRALNAAVYTQTTDVETECNGLLTYDRAVAKIDPAVLLAANRGEFPGSPMKVILADAMLGRTKWRYTTENPGSDQGPVTSDTKQRDGETEKRRNGEVANSPIRPLADSPTP